MSARPRQEAGFTLIEMVIALALFALVSVAGISLIDAVVRVEERTAGRLDRLGQAQRAMFLLVRDLEQLSRGSLVATDGGIRFTRNAATVYEPGTVIAYSLRGDRLYRLVGGGRGVASPQLLLSGVTSAKWTFLGAGDSWADAIGAAGSPDAQPIAVAVDLLVDQGESGLSGTLRRVVELPAPAEIPPDLAAAASQAQVP